jgi:predicted nucleotidyltransferase
MIAISRDLRDLLRLFRKNGVDFAVCGGHAVTFHGYPRVTMDVDLLVAPNPENASRIMQALLEFGFGKAGIPKTAFMKAGTAVTLGVQPNQIDLLTSMSRTPAHDIISRAVVGRLAGVPVRFVSLGDLLEAKRQAGRKKDLADIEGLRKPTRSRPTPKSRLHASP